MLMVTSDNISRKQAPLNPSTRLILIDTIAIDRILKRNGHDQFVISVYLHHQPQKTPLTLLSPTELFFRTRQPRYLTSSSYSNCIDRSEPDFEILHRYSEFIELRNSLSAIANGAHHKIAAKHNLCAFCRPLLEFLNHDRKRPSKGLKLLSSSKTQMEYLASFIHRLVGMAANASMEAQQQPQHQQGNCCDAVLQVAMVLEDFLRKPKQSPSLGII